MFLAVGPCWGNCRVDTVGETLLNALKVLRLRCELQRYLVVLQRNQLLTKGFGR